MIEYYKRTRARSHFIHRRPCRLPASGTRANEGHVSRQNSEARSPAPSWAPSHANFPSTPHPVPPACLTFVSSVASLHHVGSRPGAAARRPRHMVYIL
jgi:hypothetical protein